MTEVQRLQKRAALRFEMEKCMARMSQIMIELQGVGSQDYIEGLVTETHTTLAFVKVETLAAMH